MFVNSASELQCGRSSQFGPASTSYAPALFKRGRKARCFTTRGTCVFEGRRLMAGDYLAGRTVDQRVYEEVELLILLAGGRIWVESMLGKGSTFLITMPLTTDALMLGPLPHYSRRVQRRGRPCACPDLHE